MKKTKICVFCASHSGSNPAYEEAARELGTALALEGRELIYGGSNCGYMGTVSTAALKAGGRVVGVIPSIFTDEIISSQKVDELVIVETMGERKKVMGERSDAFVALPGGVGTLDEITEMLTVNQLSSSMKPIALLNVDGFYDPFVAQMERALADDLVGENTCKSILTAETVPQLLRKLDEFDGSGLSDRVSKIRDASASSN